WLALRALSVNGYFLQLLLPEADVTGASTMDLTASQRPAWRIVDAHAFATVDDARPDRLPHSWAATSDAVAARVAEVTGARRLVLLKSVHLPPGMDWSTAAQQGLVDPTFPEVVGRIGARLNVTWVNLQQWPDSI